MKAILVPLYFETATDPDFLKHIDTLTDETQIGVPVALGSTIPPSGCGDFSSDAWQSIPYGRSNSFDSFPATCHYFGIWNCVDVRLGD